MPILETEEVAVLLRGKDVNEIDELKRQGLSIRAISRITGYCRKTITKYLKGPKGLPEYGPRPSPAGKLEALVKLQRFCKKEVGQTGPFEFS